MPTSPTPEPQSAEEWAIDLQHVVVGRNQGYEQWLDMFKRIQRQAYLKGFEQAREMAALVIDENGEQVNADNSRTMRGRNIGDLMGTGYSTAIRLLQPPEDA